MTEPVTQEQLEQACREWQQRLRLADWRITVRWQDWASMSVLGRAGEVKWNLQQKSANIWLLPPGQRCDGNPGVTDGCWEKTLVHELLHLHFALLDVHPTGSPEETALEQAINAISEALELERAARRVTVARLEEAVEAAKTVFRGSPYDPHAWVERWPFLFDPEA